MDVGAAAGGCGTIHILNPVAIRANELLASGLFSTEDRASRAANGIPLM